MLNELYEKDYYLWLEAMVNCLKQKQLAELDWEHLIEEIEQLARSERREVKSRLIVLLTHLLKWKYQSEKITDSETSWISTINEQRRQLELLLEDSPSLRHFLASIFIDCYPKACREASKETKLPVSTFPPELPFTQKQVLDFDYLP